MSSSRVNARFAILAAALLVPAFRPACAPAAIPPVRLTKEEVEQIVAQAATEASRIDRSAIIAVTDREGFLLALWDVKKRLPQRLPPFDVTLMNEANVKLYALVAGAVTRASTAAFLSSDENAFTSRTAGYIIQQHFPPGVRNTAPGPLVGVGFSNLFYSDVNRLKKIPALFNGATPIATTLSPGARAAGVPFSS